jgi:hypothetical protein
MKTPNRNLNLNRGLSLGLALTLTACTPWQLTSLASGVINFPPRLTESRKNPVNANCFWGNYAEVRESQAACTAAKGEWRK